MDEIVIRLARWLNANKTGMVFIWFGDEKKSALPQRKFLAACRKFKSLTVFKSGYVLRTGAPERTTAAFIGDPNSAYFVDCKKFKFYVNEFIARERQGLFDYLREQGKDIEVIVHDR